MALRVVLVATPLLLDHIIARVSREHADDRPRHDRTRVWVTSRTRLRSGLSLGPGPIPDGPYGSDAVIRSKPS